MNIGIDIGGTFIKAGIVDKGKIIRKIAIPTEVNKEKKVVVNNVLKCVAELVREGSINGVGIGCPGSIDHKRGMVISSTNLPIAGINFPKLIKKKFSLPAKINNDANCFALAEFKYGAGKGSRNMIGITMGTGIGSGVITNGELYIGRGRAAELGHTIIKYNGELCNCGKRGHVEAYLGIKGIQRRFGKALAPKEIFELAQKGNKKAIKTWQETGRYLGLFVTNIIHTFDPDVIVIWGSVANAWKFFNMSMYATIGRERLLPKTKVVKAKLEDAGVIGAAELVNTK